MEPLSSRKPRNATDIRGCVEQLASSQRVLVLGSSGSGKTTFSRCLARMLAIEPIHLDAHFWQPGWIPTSKSDWRRTVVALVQRKSWIMDGTYEETLDVRIPAADALVVIEASRLGCLWRVVKRKLTAADADRPDAPPGQPIDRAFLRYIWNYPTVTRPLVDRLIRQYGAEKKLIVIRRTRDAWPVSESIPTRWTAACSEEPVAKPPVS